MNNRRSFLKALAALPVAAVAAKLLTSGAAVDSGNPIFKGAIGTYNNFIFQKFPPGTVMARFPAPRTVWPTDTLTTRYRNHLHVLEIEQSTAGTYHGIAVHEDGEIAGFVQGNYAEGCQLGGKWA